MRGHAVIAAVLATCGALALSGPARADQYDFISELDNSGVSYASITDMIGIGKELCHDLRNDVSPSLVLGKLRRTGFAPTEAAIILTAAVNTMCPDTKSLVVAWARGNGYTGPV
ncbi:DUF732 domain-containing protein [Mycobacterium gordonae]|uniref:DUF732 domain-containing protein n=1 Tax=Mycobacterium gordonae TaxID=1778 RepID=A0A1X1WFN4_MYCGO|nr:DUF732 domain-containing protein [Mycobacterium gordonae]MCV7007540.1 DUF732 domain-containing protein [Mycobacterium gordonae]ODR23995.1 hypothetical protein BHQ23_02505 [Mycobacterium gordonae]ORV85393.1 hypothetical protein AWC08_25625 [Mycobacterium gordonae]PJE06502.1 MAG: DUF732 domain-containing protein [Mycobacterium sp.]